MLATACGSGSSPRPAAPTARPVPAANVARESSFLERARLLSQAWDSDVSQGVPADSLLPLRRELASSVYEVSPPSAALWAKDDGSALLKTLTDRTAAAWSAAMDAARQRASRVLDSWTALVAQYGSHVPADAASAEAGWPAQLDGASTPAALDGLAATWTPAVTAARDAAAVAQAAADKLAAELRPYASINDLLNVATGAVNTAHNDNLDDMQVPGPLAALRSAAAASDDPAGAIAALQDPLRALRSLINQDSNVAGALAGLQNDIDSAVAMSTTHSATFPAQYDDVAAAFHAASEAAALDAVSARIAQLDSVVNADPSPNGCSRSAAGKVITISLSQQRVVFSQDGCTVRTSLVTTGRDQLRTPTGTFHIFSKATHFTFISPWPKGSPFYYVPSVANYAMGFLAGGYYIHDAPWEPNSQFGPGGENGPNASHGCVHIESDVMPWLFGWADIGTTVVITG